MCKTEFCDASCFKNETHALQYVSFESMLPEAVSFEGGKRRMSHLLGPTPMACVERGSLCHLFRGTCIVNRTKVVGRAPVAFYGVGVVSQLAPLPEPHCSPVCKSVGMRFLWIPFVLLPTGRLLALLCFPMGRLCRVLPRAPPRPARIAGAGEGGREGTWHERTSVGGGRWGLGRACSERRKTLSIWLASRDEANKRENGEERQFYH